MSCTEHGAMSEDEMGSSLRSCQMSMLWNWYTIDACFLSSSWHVKSNGAFAGSCIGVISLVLVLEALRRLAREYEAYIQLKRYQQPVVSGVPHGSTDLDNVVSSGHATTDMRRVTQASFAPTFLEQLVRSLLHMLQFAVAYFIMLLAMYFNGYIIISIFVGAFLGAFLFGQQKIRLMSTYSSGEKQGVTYCCA